MDIKTFQKELNKCKIVRLEDHYKLRLKRPAVKSAAKPLISTERKHVDRDKAKVAAASSDTSFWVQLEEAISGVLTPVEAGKFIAEMRKGMKTASEKISLEDLDAAASSL